MPVALVCTRGESRHRTHVSETTFWGTWEEALDAHRELSPCHHRDCVLDHLLVGRDAAGRIRVIRPPHPTPRGTPE